MWHRNHRRDGTGDAFNDLEQNLSLFFRTGIGEMAPIGEIAGGAQNRQVVLLTRDRTRFHPSHGYGTRMRRFHYTPNWTIEYFNVAE